MAWTDVEKVLKSAHEMIEIHFIQKDQKVSPCYLA